MRGLRIYDTGALISACGTYRYTLWRSWAPSGEHVIRKTALWLMTNPSTADAFLPDPTITRCIRFSWEWGCNGLVVGNLMAFRSASPEYVAAARERGVDVVGPANAPILSALLAAPEVSLVIAAWGAHPNNQHHVAPVLALARAAGREVQCLGVAQDGSPKHPLARGKSFVPYTQRPIPLEVPR